MDKIKLILPEEKLKELPKLHNLRLNLNGRKPRKGGKNTYKRALAQFRRSLRW